MGDQGNASGGGQKADYPSVTVNGKCSDVFDCKVGF